MLTHNKYDLLTSYLPYAYTNIQHVFLSQTCWAYVEILRWNLITKILHMSYVYYTREMYGTHSVRKLYIRHVCHTYSTHTIHNRSISHISEVFHTYPKYTAKIFFISAVISPTSEASKEN